jgi:hypothetical protein
VQVCTKTKVFTIYNYVALPSVIFLVCFFSLCFISFSSFYFFSSPLNPNNTKLWNRSKVKVELSM